MLNSPIDEIKSRLDIIEVIGSYIKLQKAGINYRALCPFHSEKKPSFFVSPSRQIWHCFGGCGEGGDIFKFVMKIEGIEFNDALKLLAKKAGVELRRQTPQYKALQTERQRLLEICELSCKFFERQIEKSKTGQEVKKYLASRGINPESIKKWRIGYAPDIWQGLSDFLTSQNYSQEEIKKAGLGLSSEKGSFYDRFRGRIIFPIFDLNSQIVGFGGRVFKEKDNDEIAKYVNTPQTVLYDKSRILYGLDKAKVDVRKQDSCLLVEGYIDAIMAHQAGSAHTVATSGTALTQFQLNILKRYTENLILGFDMDIAGDTATKRGIDLAQTMGFNIKVLRLPQGKDAADFILNNAADWQKALSEPKSILDFYFDSAFNNADPSSPEGKKQISKIILPIIKRIPNRIEQAHWMNLLAKRLSVKEEDIEEELKKTTLEGYSDAYGLEQEEIAKLPQKTRREMLEERLAILALRSPECISLIKKEDLEQISKPIKEILKKAKKQSLIKKSGRSPKKKKILKKKKEENKEQEIDRNFDLFSYLALRSEIEEIEEKDISQEIQCCLKELQKMNSKDRLNLLSQEIKKAEQEKNWKKVNKLTKEFNQLAKQQCQN